MAHATLEVLTFSTNKCCQLMVAAILRQGREWQLYLFVEIAVVFILW